MNSASKQTYISANMMAMYQEARKKKLQEKEQPKSLPPEQTKKFSDDCEEEKVEVPKPSMPKKQPLASKPLKPIPEEPAQKKGGFFSNLFGGGSKKPAIVNRRNSSDCSDECLDEDRYMVRNMSACECDSDDLEGDMNLSDSDDGVDKRQMFKNQRK